MFVSCSLKKGQWVVALDYCELVDEFQAVIDTPELGVMGMVYVCNFADSDSRFVKVFELPEQRQKKIRDTIFKNDIELFETIIVHPKIHAAIEQLEIFCKRSVFNTKKRGQISVGYLAKKYA